MVAILFSGSSPGRPGPIVPKILPSIPFRIS